MAISLEGKGSRFGIGVSLAALLLLGALLLLVARSEQNPDASDDQLQLPIVRIGYLPHHGFLPVFVGLEEHLFEDHGVTAKAIRFESSPALGTSLVNGDLDIVPISTAVALSIESRDPGKFQIFAVSSETQVGYLTALVRPLNSKIRRVEDLRGKKIGIFPGPGARALFGLLLERHNLKPGLDLTLQELPPPVQIQALVTGQVDALATYEPIATQAVIEFGAVKFFPAAVETDVLQPTQGGVWLVSLKALRERRPAMLAAIRALYSAIDKIRTAPAMTRGAISRYTGVSDRVAAALPIIPYSKIGEIDMKAFEQHVEILKAAGVLRQDFTFDNLLMSGTRELPND